jgi:hypothetical protein
MAAGGRDPDEVDDRFEVKIVTAPTIEHSTSPKRERPARSGSPYRGGSPWRQGQLPNPFADLEEKWEARRPTI